MRAFSVAMAATTTESTLSSRDHLNRNITPASSIEGSIGVWISWESLPSFACKHDNEAKSGYLVIYRNSDENRTGDHVK